MAKFWNTKFGNALKGAGKWTLNTLDELSIPVLSQVASMATGILGSNWKKNTVDDRMSGAEREAFNLNAQEAQKARDWNLEMDNTKYQRQVTDMQKAGINPALAMNGGVTTQATSNATGNASTQQTPIMPIQDFATLAMNLKNLKAQNENIEADTRKKNAEAEAFEIENTYRDQYEQAKLQGQKNANNLTEAQEKEVYKRIDKAIEEINVLKQQAKTEEEKQRNYAVDTLLKKANAKQIEALTPVLVKLNEAKTNTEKAIAAQAFANAAYQQGLIDSGYIESLAEKEGFNAEQAKQIALDLSGDNVRRGYTDTLATGEEFFPNKGTKIVSNILWQIGDLAAHVLNIGINFSSSSSKSKSNVESHSTSTSTSYSTSESHVHSYKGR